MLQPESNCFGCTIAVNSTSFGRRIVISPARALTHGQAPEMSAAAVRMAGERREGCRSVRGPDPVGRAPGDPIAQRITTPPSKRKAPLSRGLDRVPGFV